MNRRQFAKQAANISIKTLASYFLLQLGFFRFQDLEAQAANITLVSETDPGAQAVRYIADKAPGLGTTKVLNPTQTCQACARYSGEIKDKVAGTVGRCQILGNRYVKAGGFCSAWIQK